MSEPVRPAAAPIELGPFALEAPLARGGMGEVWRGYHLAQGVPVAIKVLTSESAREARFRQSFRLEARAMAGLLHAGIVQIHEFGDLSVETAAQSGGRLVAGSPYLVMEYVPGGSLDRASPPQTWRRVRDLLLGLLDALAHAHAHGIVHRDLKPGNILLTTDGRPKLADFGIAHPLSPEVPGSASAAAALAPASLAGTPELMAPEQCHGRVRDFGPWTDLYALGCVAWMLLTGRLPFVGATPLATITAQVTAPLPTFEPRMGVPAGTEAWLQALLVRPAHLRFQRAADAAFALCRLGDVESLPALGDAGPLGFLAGGGTLGLTSAWAATALSTSLPPDESGFGAGYYSGEPAVEGCVIEPFPRPPLPDPAALSQTGELSVGGGPPLPAAHADHMGQELLGTGLGLFDLRPVPLTGRGPLRQLLWEHLTQAARTGKAKGVLLRGAAGVGKSRLAEWLAARAHETGAALTLRVQNGPTTPPAEALADMLRRHLRTFGLAPHELRERVRALLIRARLAEGALYAATAALVDVLRPPDAEVGADAPPRFSSSAERHAVVAGFLALLARERPVLVHVDDAQWGLDALDFVRFCLEQTPFAQTPLLFVITLRDEELTHHTEERQLLDGLIGTAGTAGTAGSGAAPQRPRLTTVEVPPMGPSEHAQLIRRLLVLDVGLARTLADRTSGNPLHAVQLVRTWVQRGWLLLGPLGFQLSRDAQLGLPDDLHTLWVGHVERVLAGLPPEAGPALELLALLGQSVVLSEWRAACREAGFEPPEALPPRLLDARLAKPLDDREGLVLAHSMLRESLERRSIEATRAPRLQSACARAVERLGGAGSEGRVARHLLLAGETERGTDWLIRGAAAAMRRGDFLLAGGELLRALQVIGARADAGSERRRVTALLLSATLQIERGALEDAERSASQAEAIALRRGWTALVAEARIRQSKVAFDRGDAPGVLRGLADAEIYLSQLNAPRLTGELQNMRGNMLAAKGRFAEAAVAQNIAERAYLEAGEALDAARCRMSHAMAVKQQGDFDTALALAREAMAVYQAQGSRIALADALHNIGELERLRGHHATAERAYRESLALYVAAGSADAAYAELNLGITLVEQGELEAASGLLARALISSERLGRRVLIVGCHIFLMPIAAARGDFEAFELHLSEAERHLTALAIVEIDLARGFDRAADAALAAGRTELAARARAQAESQWKTLRGSPEGAFPT